ncbi:Y-family DNA polymerase [Marinobacter sp. X15-166B]|uniref:Y-family DNA polymerase n=1 Tax=Marinobacter sp. X15-166B TaxID=1897620 RepID=UPI00085C0292|nr:DNA polymerase Y family protein [Marinobacter sp. X15-166B]OEY67649.1 DNA repair protein [Marinobacter sp. X15-166B]
MLWLYLHFPHLILDHLRRHHERRQALVVVEGSGQNILQVCPEARTLGVRPGMRLKTATSLAPDLTLVRADPAREARVLEDQALWLYRHVAHIVLCPPAGILMEIGSMLRLYDGLAGVWSTLQRALEERQLTATLATGYTPLAARLLARAHKGECTATREQLTNTLARLSLSAAGFDARTCTRLQRLGLNTLGQVAALPPAELAHRLSPQILAHVQKIQGTRADPQTPWQPPRRFRQQTEFVQDIEQASRLLFPLRRMLTELEAYLCWRQQDTDCLLLKLHHRHREPSRLRIRTSGPEHRAETFLGLIRLRLEQQPLPAPVTQMKLSVKRFLGRATPGGPDLLGDGQDLSEAWHTLVSRLQARLGNRALIRLSPKADHRPEHAWSATEVQRAHRADPALKHHHYPDRPLWLLPEPRPLTETPQAWLAGPERISSGWWEGQRVQRDYYVAQLPDGQLAWVFRGVNSHWFVHGWFG